MPRSLERILLIDDDDEVRFVTFVTLAKVGHFVVEEAASGAEGVKKSVSFLPDIILLDVMMPGMDGPAVLTQIRGNPATAAIPVVFHTAKAMPKEVKRLQALGAADVITKPYDPQMLCDQLRAIWSRLER